MCVSGFSSSDNYITEVFDLPYRSHGSDCPPGSFANPLPKRRGELEWIASTILLEHNEQRRLIKLLQVASEYLMLQQVLR